MTQEQHRPLSPDAMSPNTGSTASMIPAVTTTTGADPHARHTAIDTAPLIAGTMPLPIRPWLAGMLLLVIAWSSLWTIKARHGGSTADAFDNSLPELAIQVVPQQVRDLIAGYLWLTADEYIHFGPSKANAGKFLAGSYAGNIEIIPVLEMALFFDPTRVDAYSILGRNLSLFLPRFQEGIRLLQRGAFYNPRSPQLHEIYAELAFNFGFIQDYRSQHKNDRTIGLRYLNEAIRCYNLYNAGSVESMSIWTPQNMQSIRARWLAEQGDLQQAMAALTSAGLTNKFDEPLTQEIHQAIAELQNYSLLRNYLIRPESLMTIAASYSLIDLRTGTRLSPFPQSPEKMPHICNERHSHQTPQSKPDTSIDEGTESVARDTLDKINKTATSADPDAEATHKNHPSEECPGDDHEHDHSKCHTHGAVWNLAERAYAILKHAGLLVGLGIILLYLSRPTFVGRGK